MTATARREELADLTVTKDRVWSAGRFVEVGTVLAGLPRATAEHLERLGLGRMYHAE